MKVLLEETDKGPRVRFRFDPSELALQTLNTGFDQQPMVFWINELATHLLWSAVHIAPAHHAFAISKGWGDVAAQHVTYQFSPLTVHMYGDPVDYREVPFTHQAHVYQSSLEDLGVEELPEHTASIANSKAMDIMTARHYINGLHELLNRNPHLCVNFLNNQFQLTVANPG